MKKFVCIFLALYILLIFSGCSEADKVNSNLSKQADYFECERRITVYNARTDTIILEAEGYMSISNNSKNELVVTVKTGPNEYKKNYILWIPWGSNAYRQSSATIQKWIGNDKGFGCESVTERKDGLRAQYFLPYFIKRVRVKPEGEI